MTTGLPSAPGLEPPADNNTNNIDDDEIHPTLPKEKPQDAGPQVAKPHETLKLADLPAGWNVNVFRELPEDVRRELLSQGPLSDKDNSQDYEAHRVDNDARGMSLQEKPPLPEKKRKVGFAGVSRGNKGDKTRKAKIKTKRGQVTMTQMDLLRRARGAGVSVVGAEEFQKGNIRECFSLMKDIENNAKKAALLTRKAGSDFKRDVESRDEIKEYEIPSPPSLSGDDEERDEDFLNSDGLNPTSGALFAEESIMSFAHQLEEWMLQVKDNVKSAHVELLRARLLELLRSHQLNKAYSELRVIRSCASSASEQWINRFNDLLHDIQTEMRTLYNKTLDLEPL
eukprot:Plantae.Rhodophyta-Hildenbrandia_rubra.ctg282.p2 GENE.Plantae.Rhodophyta-Hildenbrandia_rubra.ctg282~~Plantae.Rhodophyta-Hildenbrandia_rubra.ctg282.p2  ORF type:complete len:340 (+),score=65.93 Plantae.Rhodophyta-Hildenbrandia_rubra.ctg282:2401-3420(+)